MSKEIILFVEDTTYTNKVTGQPKIVTGNTIQGLIKYLEKLCERQFKMTRKEFMVDRSDLIGYSEDNDATFYDQMKEHFRIGIIRNGRLVETDIMRMNQYHQKDEYGD